MRAGTSLHHATRTSSQDVTRNIRCGDRAPLTPGGVVGSSETGDQQQALGVRNDMARLRLGNDHRQRCDGGDPMGSVRFCPETTSCQIGSCEPAVRIVGDS